MILKFEDTSLEFQKRFKDHLPFRILLRKAEDSSWECLTEESFNMNWSKHFCNIFWSGTAYSNFGTTHSLDAIGSSERNKKNDNETIFDPFSDECPIQIDWEGWADAKTKYYKRNAPVCDGVS